MLLTDATLCHPLSPAAPCAPSLTPQAELAPGLALLGPVEEKFIEVRDVCEPVADGTR